MFHKSVIIFQHIRQNLAKFITQFQIKLVDTV